MSSKKDVLRQQRRWAESAGCSIDARGYVARVDDNLRRPAAASTLAAFERAASSELKPGRTRPPRLFALHSSAALVVNVFEYWRDRDLAPLMSALTLTGEGSSLAFEEPFATGLEGDPPHIDVALELRSGGVVAIESKFTEWLTRRPPNRAAFKPKYFAGSAQYWTQRSLPGCQALAASLQERSVRFKFLNAAQLLKHALALAACGSRAIRLCYLYYDWPGSESKLHRAEIERFCERVTPEIQFTPVAYQDVYRRLRVDPRVDAAYLEYLRARYFAKVA